MMESNGGLRLNRLRVLYRGRVAYDESFHEGINIIRGQNGSGKSTIADFIFFVLGGEFDDWKEAAKICDEVQAEVYTMRGPLTLRRIIDSKIEPVFLYFGMMAEASNHALESWERLPLRRQGRQESFSQVMFRSLMIPEAQSEGASNITMHQLLRLCYADQRSPAARLFRFESFDTHSIREAVGDLICGIGGYEIYEIGLALREEQKELSIVDTDLAGLLRALPPDEAFRTAQLIKTAIEDLAGEKADLQNEIKQVDSLVKSGEVKGFLKERRKSAVAVSRARAKVESIERNIGRLELELREVRSFQDFLEEQSEKLSLAEGAYEAVGSIEFTRCPACGTDLEEDVAGGHCIVCKSEIDPDQEQSRYNQIRLDLEIQTRESKQLATQKHHELDSAKSERRRARAAHERSVTEFEMRFAGANGPREAFLAERTSRIGHIDAEIEFLIRNLEVAEEIEKLNDRKQELKIRIGNLKERLDALQKHAVRRRSVALSRVSKIGASILRADFKRQEDFEKAEHVELNFLDDAISVDGHLNFAESSNVFLKNTAILSLLLAAGEDPEFFHPRFLLLDNIEDKGMEEARSHLFQRIVVERATELEVPYQVIFTTSMMNPELELDDYTIGPPYTKEHKTLNFEATTLASPLIAHAPMIEADEAAISATPDLDEPTIEPPTVEGGTKLDLARAYIDMGYPDRARNILEEVLDVGDEVDKQRAEDLLDDLFA